MPSWAACAVRPLGGGVTGASGGLGEVSRDPVYGVGWHPWRPRYTQSHSPHWRNRRLRVGVPRSARSFSPLWPQTVPDFLKRLTQAFGLDLTTFGTAISPDKKETWREQPAADLRGMPTGKGVASMTIWPKCCETPCPLQPPTVPKAPTPSSSPSSAKLPIDAFPPPRTAYLLNFCSKHLFSPSWFKRQLHKTVIIKLRWWAYSI